MNNYLILFTLSLFEYIYDKMTTMKCDHIIGNIFLYLHHVLAVYVFIGWYLFNPRYHLYLMLFMVFHWITNNRKCWFTEVTNNYCGHPPEPYIGFNDITELLDLDKIIPNLSWIVMISVIFIDFYILTTKKL